MLKTIQTIALFSHLRYGFKYSKPAYALAGIIGFSKV
jgi:hypothetical protein